MRRGFTFVAVRVLALLAMGGLTLAIGFAIGWAQSRNQTSRPPRLPRASAFQTAGTSPAEPVIGPETRVVYRTEYAQCPEEVTQEQMRAPASLHGMSESELGLFYRQWRVQSFGPTEVVLERRVDAPCPHYQNWRHVRLVDGTIHIFYGTIERPGPLKERTGITVDQLPASERVRLRQGVNLRSDEQVRLFLERDD